MSGDPSRASDWVDDRPAHPMLALAADLATRLHGRGLRALIAALEHLLRQQSWARDRLRMHAGSVVRVGVVMKLPAALPPPDVWLSINADGCFQLADPGTTPRATLLLQPSADALSDFSRSGVEGLARHLRVEGDVMLAATLGELARHLRWDAEEDLSRVVGDVVAHRAFESVRSGLDRLRGLTSLPPDAAVRQAAGVVEGPVTATALHGLREVFGALDQRLNDLERRAERMAASPR